MDHAEHLLAPHVRDLIQGHCLPAIRSDFGTGVIREHELRVVGYGLTSIAIDEGVLKVAVDPRC